MKHLISALLLLGPLFTHPILAAYPSEFKVTYQLKKIGLIAAETVITLDKKDHDTWVYQSSTETKGLVSLFRSDKIIEKTILKRFPDEIKPILYNYIHEGSKKNRNQAITFDWKNKKAKTILKGHKNNISISDDAIDNFSLQLRIMNDLNDGKLQLAYNIINKGKLKSYKFEMLGKETIDTPLGELNTTKIKRTRKNGKRTTIMWLSPELHYLPVKIQHLEKDGTDFSLKISQISGPITKGKKYGEIIVEEDD